MTALSCVFLGTELFGIEGYLFSDISLVSNSFAELYVTGLLSAVVS